jgi:Reverse transcriptase (RNA-dependent DNA polymerase)
MQQQTWDAVYRLDSVNDKYSLFYSTFFQSFGASFPARRVCFDSRKPFRFPASLKEEAERLKMYSKYVRAHPSDQDIGYLKNWRNHYQWKLLQVKAQYNSGIIEKSSNKIKAAWRVVNTSLGNEESKIGSTIKLSIAGELIENPVQVANLLNEKFIVQRADTENLPDLSHINRSLKIFFLAPTTPYEVLQIINSLSNTKAAGADEIPCTVMKQVGGLISTPFSDIVNASFEQGVYPDPIKLADVIAVFKNKGEETDPFCYRPIVMLSCFSKIIGKIFSLRLISFFEQNNLLYKHQHGFMKKKGTATALFELVNEIHTSLEEGQKCMGVFYDFSKAFDSISHQILLKKLERYGIVGIPLKWIESFLSGRTQRVRISYIEGNDIKTAYSEKIENNTGIGQGSILGPNIFTIFINDLAMLILIAFLVLYADDSNALLKAPTVQILYNNARLTNSIFETWARDHLLNLNSGKTAVLQFNTQRKKVESSPLLHLDGRVLQTSEHTKFLGVYVDESLDFKTHCVNLNSKLSSSPFMFVILRRSTYNLATLKSVYFAYVQSHLQFGIICWGNSTLASLVFQTQKKIVRAMLGFRYKRYYKALKSGKELFPKLGILTLPSLYIFECSKFYRKHTHYFAQQNEAHNYNTRRNTDAQVTTHSKSPHNNAANAYNKLPRELKSIKSYQTFVKKLREFLLQKCYYSLEDYKKEIWQS